MIAKLEISQSKIRDILDGLHNIVNLDEDYQEDFNLVSLRQTGQLKIYIRYFNLLQVVHTLEEVDDPTIDLDVNSDSEMVFSSDTLTKLIKESDSDRLNLRFSEERFSVETRDSWFSTPTTFTLNMFNESEFQALQSVSGFEKIASIKRGELLKNLDMMSIVSNIVQFRLNNGEFWIAVNDAVNGEGSVMKEVPDPQLDNFIYHYRIDTLSNFLKSVDTDEIDVYLTDTGTLKLEADNQGHIAELMIAPRSTS